MKRTVPRRIPLLCCTALACVLLAGCAAGDTASTPVGPQSAASPGSTAAPAAPAFADDGRLRMLYNSDYGTTIPFRGITPLTGGEDAQTLWLLNDYTTDEYTYYAAGTPQGDESLQYRVYNADGTLVYYCGEERPLSVVGDWLLLSESSYGVDVAYGSSSRMVNLITGESKPLPSGGASFELLPDGGYALNGWTEDYIPYCYLLDDKLNEVAHFDNAQLYTPYQYDSCGWLELSRQVEAEWGYGFETALYDPATGAELAGYVELVADGVACRKISNIRYGLYDLVTGTVLAEGGQKYLLYHNGIVITEQPNGKILRDNEGQVYSITGFDRAEDGTLVVYNRSKALVWVYDPEGTLLYTMNNISGEELEALNGGRFLTTIHNWQVPKQARSFLYGAEGLIYRTEPGSYVSQRTDNYMVITRISYADSYRYDIRDYEGNLLVESLAGLPGTPEEDLLPARRGYTIGWMDLEGNWLWSQRMFTGIDDEKDYYWY